MVRVSTIGLPAITMLVAGIRALDMALPPISTLAEAKKRPLMWKGTNKGPLSSTLQGKRTMQLCLSARLKIAF